MIYLSCEELLTRLKYQLKKDLIRYEPIFCVAKNNRINKYKCIGLFYCYLTLIPAIKNDYRPATDGLYF